jgi:hypothetical protein
MDPRDIVVVSGLPRSGTSMMMRMLAAAGVPPLTDGLRTADEDNPNGYFELEAVKRTKADASWVAGAHGKAVKMVHLLLGDLPPAAGWLYRVIVMRRDLDEVVASQAKMLARTGKKGGGMTPEALKRVFATQLESVDRAVRGRADMRRLEVSYNAVVGDPGGAGASVADFLGLGPDAGAMMAAGVDPALYRNRAPQR